MRKLLTIGLILFSGVAYSQNVGVGATTPNMKLHISSPSDTALVQVDNNVALSNGSNVGLYFKNGNFFTGALKTTGTGSNVARLSLWTFAAGTTSGLRERLSILDNGNVGINNTTPASTLDVTGSTHISGNMDVDGTIAINGGSPGVGKVLTSDAAGNANWQTPDVSSCFQNLKEISSAGNTNWTVPAGVTKIWVEMWGSGGTGTTNTFPQTGGGGGAGGYASFFVPVTPGSSVTVSITSGNSNYTEFSYGGDFIRTGNGENGYAASGGGRGGNFTRGGVSFSLNAFYSSGQDGENSTYSVSEDNTAVKTVFFRGGNGADAYKGRGGKGEVWGVAYGSGINTGTNRGLAGTPQGFGSGSGARTHFGGASPSPGVIGAVLIYY